MTRQTNIKCSAELKKKREIQWENKNEKLMCNIEHGLQCSRVTQSIRDRETHIHRHTGVHTHIYIYIHKSSKTNDKFNSMTDDEKYVSPGTNSLQTRHIRHTNVSCVYGHIGIDGRRYPEGKLME